MPAAVQETNKVDHSEQMWKTLKAHILRERARKKQEREQEVEEERLRKERKAREQQLQQDVMTLGETREQISQLETRLIQLKEEKHQLFIQLKKVLNEDDSRRRQLIVRENPSENNEQMIAIQTLPSNMVHQQLFNIQQPSRLAPMPQQQQQNAFKTAIKRPRSPSPQPQVPVSLYHGYGYKPPTVGTPSYQSSPQKDDGRRNELSRAVLWNKTQYTNQPSAFYPVGPQELSIYYPLSREPARNVYESPRPQAFHLEQKLPEHYALRTSTSHGHVIHPGSLPINPQQGQPKGSITTGYPVRSQPQYQQQSAAPASLYTTQSRPLYQTSGATMNYPTRE